MTDSDRARQLLEFALLAKDAEWMEKLVEAFAEVRAGGENRGLERAACIAEQDGYGPAGYEFDAGDRIAKSIRALKGTE